MAASSDGTPEGQWIIGWGWDEGIGGSLEEYGALPGTREVLAATGSAVGLGNIWKFPYITGENGGGYFVLIYLVCIVVVGLPIMIAEVLMGRATRATPVRAFGELAGKASSWKVVGWMGVAAGFVILSYYSVIAGWTLAYIVKSATGTFVDATAPLVVAELDAFKASTGTVVFVHSLFMTLTIFVVARGTPLEPASLHVVRVAR